MMGLTADFAALEAEIAALRERAEAAEERVRTIALRFAVQAREEADKGAIADTDLPRRDEDAVAHYRMSNIYRRIADELRALA